MTTRARVQAYGRQGYVTVTPEATYGATIGTNVFNADGSLFVPAAAATPAADVAVTIWRLVLEIPANVVALENATGAGLFAVTGAGVGAFRSITGTAGRVTVANGDAVAGNPTIDLDTLADSGAGAFKLVTRDAYGRMSGTANGTTDNVPEGAANLYHTTARARAAAVSDAIEDGVTDVAPSQNAVFDALAGKGNVNGQTWAGNHTFSGAPTVVVGSSTGGAVFEVDRPGSTPAGSKFQISSPSSTPGFVGFYSTTSRCDLRFGANLIQLGASASTAAPTIQLEVTPSSIRPGGDNTINNGEAGRRWKEIFAGNAVINTSDAREKRIRGPLTKPEIAAAREIKSAVAMFQWTAAIAEKGEDARLHCSPTVQSVIAIMEKHGLDPFRYGFVCYDQWGETPEVVEDGVVVQEYRPAGDRYSLRPTELLLFIMAAL